MAKDNKKTVVYSALEVANVCGVANQTAINWIRNGYLKAYSTPGGQYRVYADDLADFMSERNMRVPDELLVHNTPDNLEKKILIVEDESGLNAVIKEYCNKHLPGIEIFQAYDGFEAGSLLAAKKPNVVILDLNLPGVDGFELCRKINETESFGHPAVIVITALQDSDIEQQVKKLNVYNFFRKPVALQDLLITLQTCLKK